MATEFRTVDLSVDSRRRVSLARLTEAPAPYYRAELHDDGSIVLTPAQLATKAELADIALLMQPDTQAAIKSAAHGGSKVSRRDRTGRL